MKCLDVGCGSNKTAGCLGVDVAKLDGVDVVHDLSIKPWPFSDSEFDKVYANHFLEHCFDIVETLREVHRIIKKDGEFEVRVPHYASYNFNTDLTHKVHFGMRSFDHFSLNGEFEFSYYTEFKFEILERELRFVGPKKRYDPFKILGIHYFANKFYRMYERFFVYWLPPFEIYFKLRVIK